jgi:hypothetical protein
LRFEELETAIFAFGTLEAIKITPLMIGIGSVFGAVMEVVGGSLVKIPR